MSQVLILTPFFSPNIGGVETHLDDLVDVLKTKNFKSYVLTYQPLMSDIKAPTQETKDNVEIHRVEWFRKLFYTFEPYPILDFLYLTPRLLVATFSFLQNHKNVKIIHAQGINAACIAVLLKPIFKTKIVVSTHAVYEFNGESLFSKVTRWVFNKSDTILSLLNHSKNELIKLGIDQNKIKPYIYWIDQKKFNLKDKTEAKKQLNWETDKLHLLFVGRMIEKKGIKELVEASKILNQKNPNIKIHIIGTGDLDAYVKQNTENLSNTEYIGKIENTVLPQYFQAADTLIVPSTHEEGAGRVIMEALSCGTAVIGSNRGGIPEILDTTVGELITVSPQAIATAIENISQRISIGDITPQKCRFYAEKKFSDTNSTVILDSYQI
jgi:glycosyltransferase involved in cell wall biosynthesis